MPSFRVADEKLLHVQCDASTCVAWSFYMVDVKLLCVWCGQSWLGIAPPFLVDNLLLGKLTQFRLWKYSNCEDKSSCPDEFFVVAFPDMNEWCGHAVDSPLLSESNTLWTGGRVMYFCFLFFLQKTLVTFVHAIPDVETLYKVLTTWESKP